MGRIIKRVLNKAYKFGAKVATILVFFSFSAAPSFATDPYPLSFNFGWNLAGNSLTTPIDVATLFNAQTGIRSVWKWEAAAQKWAFYTPLLDTSALAAHAAAKGYSVLGSINQGEAYWVFAADPVAIGTQNGTGFSLSGAHLVNGWNLVATGDNVSPAAFAAATGNVTTLWSWDNANSAWYFYSPALAANNTLATYIAGKNYQDFGPLTLGGGRGFWVNIVGTITSTVSAGNGQASISWPALNGAGSYNILRNVNGGTYTTLAVGVTSPYVDSGLTNGSIYGYIVVARDAANTSDVAQSAAQNATPAPVSLGQNGLALSLGGHTYTLGNASVYRFSPSGKRELEVENPLITPTSLADMTRFQNALVYSASLTLPVATGTKACGTGADDASFSLVLSGGGDWGGTYNATGCSVRIDYMSSRGGMSGEILSANLSNGAHTITLENAPFRVYQHNGTPGTPPALSGNAWATLNVTSGTFELPGDSTTNRYFVLPNDTGNKVGSSFSYGADPNDGSKPVTVNGIPSNIAWIIQNSFFTTANPTNYNCGTVYTGSATLNMQVWLGTYLAEAIYVSAPGGSCVITIDQLAGGLYKGRYTATLKLTDTLLTTAEKTLAVNGEFRNFLTNAYSAGNGGNEGSLPNDGSTNGATLLIDDGSTHWTAGEQFKFDYQSNSFLNTSSFRATFVHPSNSKLNLRLFEVPRAVGTYACGTIYNSPSNTQKTSMDIVTDRGVTYSGGLTGQGANSSCSVQITRYDTKIEGTYTATLSVGNNAGLASTVLPNNDATITVSGSFRATPP